MTCSTASLHNNNKIQVLYTSYYYYYCYYYYYYYYYYFYYYYWHHDFYYWFTAAMLTVNLYNGLLFLWLLSIIFIIFSATFPANFGTNPWRNGKWEIDNPHFWKFQTIFSNSSLSNILVTELHPIRPPKLKNWWRGETPRLIVSIIRCCYNYYHRNVDCKFLKDGWTDHDETFTRKFFPQNVFPQICFPQFFPPKNCSPKFFLPKHFFADGKTQTNCVY